jgi:hypothetical protein
MDGQSFRGFSSFSMLGLLYSAAIRVPPETTSTA